MDAWMNCPSCEGLFRSPVGSVEGDCVFCGVHLKVHVGVKMVRPKDESGVLVHPGWEDHCRARRDGREDRPMFLVKKEDREMAVY